MLFPKLQLCYPVLVQKNSNTHSVEEIKTMRKNDVQDTRKKTNRAAKNASSELWIVQRKNALNYSDKQRFTIMFGAVMPM